MENYPYRKLKQHEKEALADSFINTSNSRKQLETPRNNKSKDPFAFSDRDSSSRQSEDSSGSVGPVDIKPNVRNGTVEIRNSEIGRRHTIGGCVR
jgi:hypothetical protein